MPNEATVLVCSRMYNWGTDQAPILYETIAWHPPWPFQLRRMFINSWSCSALQSILLDDYWPPLSVSLSCWLKDHRRTFKLFFSSSRSLWTRTLGNVQLGSRSVTRVSSKRQGFCRSSKKNVLVSDCSWSKCGYYDYTRFVLTIIVQKALQTSTSYVSSCTFL